MSDGGIIVDHVTWDPYPHNEHTMVMALDTSQHAAGCVVFQQVMDDPESGAPDELMWTRPYWRQMGEPERIVVTIRPAEPSLADSIVRNFESSFVVDGAVRMEIIDTASEHD